MGRLRKHDRPASVSSPVDRASIASLSVREEQVLSFAASGLLDKEIGVEMGVSLNTLRTYWQRIRSKVGDVPRAALAVAYVEHNAVPAVAAREPSEPAHDWELDLATRTIRRVSDRPLAVDLPKGEDLPIEEVLAHFHPQDQPRLRSLIASISRGELGAFVFTARVIDSKGMQVTSVFVQVERDANGRPVKLVGMRIPLIEIGRPEIEDVKVGYWTRELEAEHFQADAGFYKIFRLAPDEPEPREAAFKRFHPDEEQSCRTFVSDTIAAERTHSRRTHRLVFDDGSTHWITTDMRIEYQDGKAVRALGTVMSFG